MAVVTMRQLLESGVHFGHQTRRWNPKMKRFIMTERNGIYIIDLQQSLAYIDRSYAFIKETVAKGGTIMFVGTKKQAQEAIAEQATRVGMPYVNQRWLGGMLTNFQTVHQRINRLKELDEIDFDDVAGSSRTKKELLQMRRERDKLNKSLGGIREMGRTPSAVWIVDTNKEHLAVEEARKLRIPIIGILDSQLRPRPGRLPDPGQRRRDPRRRPADPGRRRRRRRGPDRPLRCQGRHRRCRGRGRRGAAGRVGARAAGRRRRAGRRGRHRRARRCRGGRLRGDRRRDRGCRGRRGRAEAVPRRLLPSAVAVEAPAAEEPVAEAAAPEAAVETDVTEELTETVGESVEAETAAEPAAEPLPRPPTRPPTRPRPEAHARTVTH